MEEYLELYFGRMSRGGGGGGGGGVLYTCRNNNTRADSAGRPVRKKKYPAFVVLFFHTEVLFSRTHYI